MTTHPSRFSLLRLIGVFGLALTLGACVIDEPHREAGVDYGYVSGGASDYDDEDDGYYDADDSYYGRSYGPSYDYGSDRYYTPGYPPPPAYGYYGPGYYNPGYYGPAYSYGPSGTIIYHYDDYHRNDRKWTEAHRRNQRDQRDNDYRPPSRSQDARPQPAPTRPPLNDGGSKDNNTKRRLLRPEKAAAPAPNPPPASAPQQGKSSNRWQDRRRAE